MSNVLPCSARGLRSRRHSRSFGRWAVLSCLVASGLLIGAVPAGAQFSFDAPLELASGSNAAALVAADFTGDTQLDIVVVGSASDDAWVYAGDGMGGFSFLSTFAVGNFPQGVAAADFDGDLDQDLATTSVPFNTGHVSAWLGNGDGSFQTPDISVADDGPRPVAIVDLDHDLELDLITTNATRGNLSVFLGNGDGTFGLELRTSVGAAVAFPTDLAIADFDEDLELDVITSNAQSTDGSLGLLLGDGDGTFAAATPVLTTCTRPESVVSGDFDGDQHADVAVACFDSSDVAVLLGDGTGGFESPVLYSLLPDSANPYWIQSADMNGDGALDLVTSNNGSFSVLRGQGDGNFDSNPFDEVIVGQLYGAIAEDFDGDGRLDLAFANFGTDELAVYLNTTPFPPIVPSMGTLPLGLLGVLLISFGAVAVSSESRSPSG